MLSPGEIAILLSRSGDGEFTDRPDLAPWAHIVTRAIALTAQISVLRGVAADVAEPGDPAPDLPELPRIEAQSLRGLDRWCAAAECALSAARRTVRRSAMRTALRRLSERRPPLEARVLAAAEVLACGRATGSGLLHRQVRRRLDALPAEVTAEQAERALGLAAQAVGAHSPVAARAYTDRLISVVLHSSTEHGRRGAASATAARYLAALATVPGLLPPVEEVTARLAQVRAGSLRLSAELHDTAERLRCRAEEIAERTCLAEVLTRSLDARGYQVRTDWTIRPPAVVVTASRGTHTGHFVIDDRVVLGGLEGMPPAAPDFMAELRGIQPPSVGDELLALRPWRPGG